MSSELRNMYQDKALMIENKQAKAFRQSNLPNQVSIGEEDYDSGESVS